MKFRTSFPLALFAACFSLSGCDLGRPESEEAGTAPGTPGDPGTVVQAPPILIDVECRSDTPCAGDVCTLVGLNFDSQLERNEVWFTAGNQRIRGLPLNVRVEPAVDGANRSSRLDVVVPGGVSRGNVELVVRGLSAGAAGFDTCPTITGFTLGLMEDQSFLQYNPLLGFFDGNSRVNLYGLSFNDVQQAQVSDASGNERNVLSSTFERNPRTTLQPGQRPTGLTFIGFDLRDAAKNVDIRLPFTGERSNMGVVVATGNAESNRFEIPISEEDIFSIREIGFVISGIKAPPGVVTGQVRLEYTCYELVVNAAWNMLVEFRARNEQFTSDWLPAKTVADDPQNNGTEGLIAGSPFHSSGSRLLPGQGAVRTFLWDAPNDPEFQRINREFDQGQSRPRYWRVDFRLTPMADTSNRNGLQGHRVESPPIVYYDLTDRPNENLENRRAAVVSETFETDALQDRRQDTGLPDASWGPPLNTGLLVGAVDATQPPSWGLGEAVIAVEPVSPASVGFDPTDEFVEFDTERMELVHHVVGEDDNGDTFEVQFLEAFENADGVPVGNPGESVGEFHFASFSVVSGVRVTASGPKPLIIRLAGDDNNPSDDDVVFHLAPETGIDVSGEDGDGENGGAGGVGGGDGGAGGTVDVGFNGGVTALSPAEAGGNNGGGAGKTPGAIHFDPNRPPQQRVIFAGSSGGGGGHRREGGAGVYGRPGIAQYQEPRSGTAGPARGSELLFPLTGGSGGGGGGASIQDAVSTFTTFPGGGGGGGGGVVKIVGRGSLLIEDEILANGGDGVSERSAGSGGGGSGGGILLQATGDILLADCGLLQVNGGEGGTGGGRSDASAGEGSPGYIRLESLRPVPFCGEIPVDEDVLSGAGLSSTSDPIEFGRGQDGALHLRFIASRDPVTGDVVRDPSTGRALSIWRYDTGTGAVVNPDGDRVLRARNPRRLDLTRLIIDEDTVLRVTGPSIFEVSVRDFADIAGTIDVAGQDGGALRFEPPGTHPLPGIGGEPGPGGGRGGAGGMIQFVDGDATNKAPANTLPIDGGSGGAPPGTEQWNVTDGASPNDPDSQLPPPFFATPTGGAGRVGNGADCIQDPLCQERIDQTSAGGGGGGGHGQAGNDGAALVFFQEPDGLEERLAGNGGSVLGSETFRLNGELSRPGGPGGAGGGAGAEVSSAYRAGGILGSYPFAGDALYAPGTGGGGGGGVLHMAVSNLELRATARLLAKGGDAYQSIDRGGNGGGGAGGSILIQVTRSLSIESGIEIDVSGGSANRLPPRLASGLLRYEGNIRSSFRGSSPDESGNAFGGLGGDGAPGRVRVEAPEGSGIFATGTNLDIQSGVFFDEVVESVGVSLPIALGLGPGFVASSFRMQPQTARVSLTPLQPSGTDLVVVWDGARDSLDIHAEVGALRQGVADASRLQSAQFVRFKVFFRSNLVTRNSLAVREIQLPYRLVLREDNCTDGVDNDHDGFVDRDDSDCSNFPVNP